MKDDGSHQRAQEQKENPHPGPDKGILTVFTQICKQAIDRDRAEETERSLENCFQPEAICTSYRALTRNARSKHMTMYSRWKTFRRPKNICLLTIPESGSRNCE